MFMPQQEETVNCLVCNNELAADGVVCSKECAAAYAMPIDKSDDCRHGYSADEGYSLDDAKRDLAKARIELDEYAALIERQHTRIQKLNALWVSEDPEARANTWADLGKLTEWATDKINGLVEMLELQNATMQVLLKPDFEVNEGTVSVISKFNRVMYHWHQAALEGLIEQEEHGRLSGPAPNYLRMTLSAPEGKDPIEVVIQRCGKMTPAMKAEKLTAELEELKKLHQTALVKS